LTATWVCGERESDNVDEASYIIECTIMFSQSETQHSPVIRLNVLQEINDALWIDQLEQKQNNNVKASFQDRCTVCTLPYGSCVHTRQWLDDSYSAKRDEFEKITNSVEDEIDSVLGVLSDDLSLTTKAAHDDIDVDSMQWNRLEQSLADKIGATPMSLFAPDERGWHSAVEINEKYILVFGGFSFRYVQRSHFNHRKIINNLCNHKMKGKPKFLIRSKQSQINRKSNITMTSWFTIY
jgi:hypothetical protein